MLLRVNDIEPAINRTLADVKDQVRDKLAKKKAEAKLQSVLDEVEESAHAGKTLKEIADQMKLQYLEVPATDRFNKTPDGKRRDQRSRMRPPSSSSAFDSQVGLENEAGRAARRRLCLGRCPRRHRVRSRSRSMR